MKLVDTQIWIGIVVGASDLTDLTIASGYVE